MYIPPSLNEGDLRRIVSLVEAHSFGMLITASMRYLPSTICRFYWKNPTMEGLNSGATWPEPTSSGSICRPARMCWWFFAAHMHTYRRHGMPRRVAAELAGSTDATKVALA